MFNGNFLKNCVKVLYLMKIIEIENIFYFFLHFIENKTGLKSSLTISAEPMALTSHMQIT